ncbi:MAG TPA: oligosaccharide flippase family protein, partial [Patescibacteria group bacterium]|nr:oligosaccharide flippase family protein [Patescibacteria group bacterium]
LAFASGISFFISLFWIKKFFTKFSIHIRKETISILLRHSWPFAIASIFVTAYFNIDTVMVKWIRGDEEAGWYSAAYNFIFAFSLIPSLMSSAFYPVLSRVHHDFITFRHKIHVYMLSISFVGLMLSALTVLFSKYIITLVYSVEYTNSVHSLRILACTLPFLFLSNFMGTVLASLNRQMIGTVIVGFSALFNIILNYVLISQSGQVGAAIASFFTFFLMCMALVVAYVFVMKYQMKPLENL